MSQAQVRTHDSLLAENAQLQEQLTGALTRNRQRVILTLLIVFVMVAAITGYILSNASVVRAEHRVSDYQHVIVANQHSSKARGLRIESLNAEILSLLRGHSGQISRKWTPSPRGAKRLRMLASNHPDGE